MANEDNGFVDDDGNAADIFGEDDSQEESQNDGSEDTDTSDEDQQDDTDESSNDVDDEAEDDKPEFDEVKALEDLRKVRNEAKNLRRRLRETEAALATAKGGEPESEEVKALREENERLRVVADSAKKTEIGAKYSLPPEIASRIQGEDAEDWEEDARLLAAVLKRKPKRTRNSGGGYGTQGKSPSKEDQLFAELFS